MLDFLWRIYCINDEYSQIINSSIIKIVKLLIIKCIELLKSGFVLFYWGELDKFKLGGVRCFYAKNQLKNFG